MASSLQPPPNWRTVVALIVPAALAAALLPAAPAHAGTGTFADPSAIGIPRAASLYSIHEAFPPNVIPAERYPADIEVSGLAGSVTDVDVTITGLRHTYPADVHLLLVDPVGHSALLMGHCGGALPVAEETFTFDDEAAVEMPFEDPGLKSATFRPANPDTATTRACTGSPVAAPGTAPQPGPTGTYGRALSVFDGNPPNGTWQLFVFDDFSDYDSGEIAGGWSLRIDTDR